MGQSYCVSNISKKESFILGLMLESSWMHNEKINKIMVLLSNHWKNDKIAWCGEFSEYTETFDYAFEHDKFISLEINHNFFTEGFIYNSDKLEKIDLKKYLEYSHKDPLGYSIHPLPILTKLPSEDITNGDYKNKSDPMLGHWAGDSIFTSFKDLNNYKDITFKVYPMDTNNSFTENDYLEIYSKRLILKDF